MKSFIRNLSASAEFCILVFICFWWGIIGSARQFVAHLTHTARPEQITNSLVLEIVIMQLMALALAFWVGRIRGWSLTNFGLRVSWKSTAAGGLLFIVTVVAIISCIVLTNIIVPGLRGSTEAGVKVSGLTLPFLILMALVNPIYEEMLGTGYYIYALQRFGMFPAVLASAFFRTFLHAYKGIDAIVIVLPMGLIFGFCYWRWRQLWPLVFAHILVDIWSLLGA